MEEQQTEDLRVSSSKLLRGIIWVRGAMGAQLLCKQKVEGSSPFGSTHLYQNRHLMEIDLEIRKEILSWIATITITLANTIKRGSNPSGDGG